MTNVESTVPHLIFVPSHLLHSFHIFYTRFVYNSRFLFYEISLIRNNVNQLFSSFNLPYIYRLTNFRQTQNQ